MSRNQRKTYRVSNADTDQVRVTVALDGGRSFEGRVADVSATGIGVDFLDGAVPELDGGSTHILAVHYWKLDAPVEIDVEVVMRRETPSGRLYGFRILSSGDFGRQFHLFNRRGAFRVEPDHEHPIDVWLAHVSDNSGVSADPAAHVRLELGGRDMRASLCDVSADGLSAAVDLSHADQLVIGAEVSVRLTFPPDSESARFEAHVARVQLVGDKLRAGLRFDEALDGFEQEQAVVRRYVMARQRERLRQLRE